MELITKINIEKYLFLDIIILEVFMEVVYKDKLCCLNKYDTNDFHKSMKDIVDDCSRIIASYEIIDDNDEDTSPDDFYDYEKDKEALNDMFVDNFLDDTKYFVYVLYNEGNPIGYAIYSQIDKTNSYILEFIHISKQYKSLGFGSLLLNKSIFDMKIKEDAGEIVSTIAKSNLKSIYLHDKFISKNHLKSYINDYGDRYAIHINISKLKQKGNDDYQL